MSVRTWGFTVSERVEDSTFCWRGRGGAAPRDRWPWSRSKSFRVGPGEMIASPSCTVRMASMS